MAASSTVRAVSVASVYAASVADVINHLSHIYSDYDTNNQ